MKRATALAALLLTPLTSGCGTFVTRASVDPHGGLFDTPPIGWYPGAAVVFDAIGIASVREIGCGEEDASALGVFLCLLSLPVDLVLDTALLPLDLVGALVGWEKALPSAAPPE